jgi:hypothetical protein
MVMDLKRRTATITSISEAYHTAEAITRHVDGRPGAHLNGAKCIVKQSSDINPKMHKFTNPLMVVHEKLGGPAGFAAVNGDAGSGHHVVLGPILRNSLTAENFSDAFAFSNF